MNREYLRYHSSPREIKRRASRNKARRIMLNGRKSNLDVGHKNDNPLDNRKSNLILMSKKLNRGRLNPRHAR